MMQGWECPKCGSVYAPHVRQCDTCKNSKVYSVVQDSGTAGITLVISPDSYNSSGTAPNRAGYKPVFTTLPTITIPHDGETGKGFAGEA